MAGVARKPVLIDRDVVSIRGGFMQFGGLASGLTTKGKDVDGKVFVTIDRKAHKMKALEFLKDIVASGRYWRAFLF